MGLSVLIQFGNWFYPLSFLPEFYVNVSKSEKQHKNMLHNIIFNQPSHK